METIPSKFLSYSGNYVEVFASYTGNYHLDIAECRKRLIPLVQALQYLEKREGPICWHR
jgi:phosphopantetheinyl transferase